MNISEIIMNISVKILIIADEYFKLILTSWPAVILILVLLILFRHRKAIDNRIRSIEKISKDAVTFGPDRSEKKEIATADLPLPTGDKETERATVPSDVALVECRIASSLPGTVTFNFLKDWKAWFWIANREPKKYKAFVKIKFIADGFEEEVIDGYYGGMQAWKLDAFSGIQAPGLGIPEEVKNAAREGKRIKIQIKCTVKDEDDNLIEEKFPQTYIYEPEDNSWFLEP